jgi:hypothetical protein
MGRAVMSDPISEARFVQLLDDKLDQIVSEPGGWGGVDALEPLVLVLLMLRSQVRLPGKSDREVVSDYRKFLAEHVGAGAGDLKSRLGADCSAERMAELLRQYIDRAVESAGSTGPAMHASPREEPEQRGAGS